VLASLGNGTIVAARQGSLLVSCFHPELTNDTRFHRAFLEQVAGLPEKEQRMITAENLAGLLSPAPAR